jgi:glutamate/tyrosine decarboxylase-like PLP-dependent enzyme
MNTNLWRHHAAALIARGAAHIARWEAMRTYYTPWPDERDHDAMAHTLDLLAGHLLSDPAPSYHPDYAGHMVRPPHPIAWAAWAMTALLNPNNQSREAGAATTELELEVIASLIRMCGLPEDQALGHLTSSGTAANLEALWIARELEPGRPLALAKNAHYNHRRIAGMLHMPILELPQDASGRIDAEAAAALFARERPAAIVVTLGTTGRGALDPLHELLPLARRYGVRVHVDAAWGGFYALVAKRRDGLLDPALWSALGEADSITIDPHKHGLQPYGCGCILYRNHREVRPVLTHESPYTYLDSKQLHLGQIQLECSRGGAAAAALWATLRHVELSPTRGFGERLASSRRAALAWHQALALSKWAKPLGPPDLDILTVGLCGEQPAASAVTRRTLAAVARLRLAGPHLMHLWLPAAEVACCWPDLVIDADRVALLRACVMKPEHERWWPHIHDALGLVSQEII